MTEKNQSLFDLCEEIEGIIIPARIRYRLSENEYAELELLMFAKAAKLGIPLTDDPDGRWGDQREED